MECRRNDGGGGRVVLDGGGEMVVWVWCGCGVSVM